MKNKLIEQIFAKVLKESGKFESRKAWQVMRDYLEQLNEEQLRALIEM